MDEVRQEPEPPAWHQDPGATDRDRTVTEQPSRLPAALSIAAIVAIVTAVIAIVVLHDGGGEPGIAVPAPSATGTADPVEIDNSAARLSYRLPGTWTPEPDLEPEILGVRFGGAASTGRYECGGREYARASVFSAAVQSTSDKRLDLRETGRRFAAEFAAAYLAAPGAAPTDGGPGEFDGHTGVLTTLPVAVPAADPACQATAGVVTVLAVDLDNASATTKRGVALLVHVADAAGGPAEPAPPPTEDLQAVIDSLAVG